MRPAPPPHSWSERVDLIDEAEIAEMEAQAARKGIYVTLPATAKIFPQFQPGDEVWEDHHRSYERDAEGNIRLSYADARCRLVRSGETIARTLHWLT